MPGTLAGLLKALATVISGLGLTPNFPATTVSGGFLALYVSDFPPIASLALCIRPRWNRSDLPWTLRNRAVLSARQLVG